MKRISLLVIALVLVAGILTAQDCNDCQRMGKGRGMGMENAHQMMNKGENQRGDHYQEMMEELDLTDTQKDALADLRSNHKKEMIQIKSDIEVLKVDKRDAMKDQDFDRVRKIVKSISAKQEEMKLKKVDFDESRWNLLDAEQQEKLQEMKRSHQGMKMKNNEKKHQGMHSQF